MTLSVHWLKVSLGGCFRIDMSFGIKNLLNSLVTEDSGYELHKVNVV